jgi:hypothetical protein
LGPETGKTFWKPISKNEMSIFLSNSIWQKIPKKQKWMRRRFPDWAARGKKIKFVIFLKCFFKETVAGSSLIKIFNNRCTNGPMLQNFFVSNLQICVISQSLLD